MKRLIIAISVAALAASAVGTTAAREPSRDAAGSDYLPGRLAQDRAARKADALGDVLSGQATAKGKNQVVKVAPGQFVELAFEGEDQILTLLGEFGPLPNNTHPGHPAHGGPPGPLHNEIPEPDRDEDNSTIWVDDFNQAHYDSLLYDKNLNPSMANWYLEQSSGTYSVDGYVSDWVQVPYNANAYGSNYCNSNVCTRDVGRFIEDQADTWWNVLVAQQGSVAAAEAFLATFDEWDRYDWNGNGEFDEPDGYIDHFQSVHAGEGEETGGGAQGTNAIWSHRSYVNSVPIGADGPGWLRSLRRRPHRHQQLLDRRLHRRAGERWRWRLRSRVRTRPRHPRPVRRWWREQHRLVDGHVAGLLRQRQRRGHRLSSRRTSVHGRSSSSVSSTTTRLSRRDRAARTTSARPSSTRRSRKQW